MVDKKKAVICCLLATSALMLSEKKKVKRKMWTKKWYLKRNISCDVHLLNELCALRSFHRGVGRWNEETVGFPEWTALFCVWKKTGKDSSEACAIACQNCAFYLVSPSGMTSHSKIAQFNWECIERRIKDHIFHVKSVFRPNEMYPFYPIHRTRVGLINILNMAMKTTTRTALSGTSIV